MVTKMQQHGYLSALDSDVPSLPKKLLHYHVAVDKNIDSQKQESFEVRTARSS